jgi:acyl-CoA hydrolase
MEVEVKVIAEDPISGEQIFTNAAYLVYVAIDDNGKPTLVPPLLAETPEEQTQINSAAVRQARRLANNSDHN